MRALPKDTNITVTVYQIDDLKPSPRQYEMHHLNTEVKLSSHSKTMSFRKGDYYIPMDQAANRFLIEVLEPQGDDSYFAWNYFDGVLGRKEGYSAYAFEDIAAAYVKQHPELRKQLNEKLAGDSTFKKSALDFVYRNSPYFEPDYLRYPVYRVE